MASASPGGQGTGLNEMTEQLERELAFQLRRETLLRDQAARIDERLAEVQGEAERLRAAFEVIFAGGHAAELSASEEQPE